MFNISKHIFSHFEFFALGASEPDFVLPNLELDAVAQFVTDFDVQIISAHIEGDGWALCDITRVPSLCHKVIITVAEHPAAKPRSLAPITAPVRNYYKDALHIQGGASNPRAVINTLHGFLTNWLKEADTPSICNDPGIRLIVHQLAHLTKIYQLNSDTEDYESTVKLCERLAKVPNLTYISRRLWPAVCGSHEPYSHEELKLVCEFLANYPQGQTFERIYDQFGYCAITKQATYCVIAQPVQQPLEQ